MRRIKVVLELQFPDDTNEDRVWEVLRAVVDRTQSDIMVGDDEICIPNTIYFLTAEEQ